MQCINSFISSKQNCEHIHLSKLIITNKSSDIQLFPIIFYQIICSDVVTLCMQVWSCDQSCGKSKIFLVEFNNYHMRVTSFYSYKYDILNPYLKHLYRWTPVPFKYWSITVDIFRHSKWLFHFNDKILFLYNNRF